MPGGRPGPSFSTANSLWAVEWVFIRHREGRPRKSCIWATARKLTLAYAVGSIPNGTPFRLGKAAVLHRELLVGGFCRCKPARRGIVVMVSCRINNAVGVVMVGKIVAFFPRNRKRTAKFSYLDTRSCLSRGVPRGSKKPRSSAMMGISPPTCGGGYGKSPCRAPFFHSPLDGVLRTVGNGVIIVKRPEVINAGNVKAWQRGGGAASTSCNGSFFQIFPVIQDSPIAALFPKNNPAGIPPQTGRRSLSSQNTSGCAQASALSRAT